MKKTLRMLGIVGAALVMSAPAMAADTQEGWYLGGGLTFACDSLKVATHKTLGLNLNAGLDRQVGDTNLGFRPAFALTFLPGNWEKDQKVSFINMQVSGDLVIPSGIDNLNVITGLSINTWQYTADSRNGADAPFGMVGTFAPRNLKLGLRLGFDYQISKRLTANAILQMVEFGNQPSDRATWDNVNPSWVELGVKYHF